MASKLLVNELQAATGTDITITAGHSLVAAASVFKIAGGRRLNSLECHDLVCKIASVVVVGGVRRSALISLSDLNSNVMRVAKSGEWYRDFPHRGLANNSAVYKERPDMNTFLKEWYSLYESKSGERGIFNRESVKNKVTGSASRLIYFLQKYKIFKSREEILTSTILVFCL